MLSSLGLLVGLCDGSIKVHDVSTRRNIFEISHHSEEVSCFDMASSSSPFRLFTFTKNGTLRLLSLTLDSHQPCKVEEESSKKLANFVAVDMKSDLTGRYLVMADPQGQFKILETQTLKALREFSLGTGYVAMKLIG